MQNMKNRTLILTALLAAAITLPAAAQVNTNNPPTVTLTTNLVDDAKSIESVAKSSGILTATNYAIEPYLTYAPHLSKSTTKIGGGILAVYNVNKYIGAGLGLDYLGKFSLVSGNASLKLPINAGKALGGYAPKSWGFLSNIVVTPFVLGGVGTPTSGANSSMSTITDTGAYFEYGHLWGGKFNVGACWGEWANAGDYSGKRYHAFMGWSKGF